MTAICQGANGVYENLSTFKLEISNLINKSKQKVQDLQNNFTFIKKCIEFRFFFYFGSRIHI